MAGLSIDEVRERFRRELSGHLRCLADCGFGEPTFRYEDDRLLPVLVARYVSAHRHLDLALVVDHSRLPDAPNRQVMTAHLYRGTGEEQDDRLSVDWFAALHRPDLADRYDQAADGSPSLEAFVRTVLPIYGALFRESMHAILVGDAWESGTGDRQVLRTFAFLERDFGFSRPTGRWCGHDLTHTYRRGAVSVSVTWDGGPHEVVAIVVGDKSRFIWGSPPERVIPVLKQHPEIFDGDFRALAGLADGTSA